MKNYFEENRYIYIYIYKQLGVCVKQGLSSILVKKISGYSFVRHNLDDFTTIFVRENVAKVGEKAIVSRKREIERRFAD